MNDIKIDRFWVLKRNRDFNANQYVELAMKILEFNAEEVVIVGQSGC